MDILNDISKAIIDASTSLSKDKCAALKNAIQNEDNDNARWALQQVLENYIVGEKPDFLCVMIPAFLM